MAAKKTAKKRSRKATKKPKDAGAAKRTKKRLQDIRERRERMRRPSYAALIAAGAKEVSRGGMHVVLCDGERHWLTDHRYRPDERKYIQVPAQNCWCLRVGEKVKHTDPNTKAVLRGVLRGIAGGNATVETDEGMIVQKALGDWARDKE